MKNWKFWCILLLLALLFAFLWYMFPRKVETVKIDVKENVEKIDSLNLIIKEKSLVIDSLKEKKNEIIIKVVEKTKRLKTLPADSTINLFSSNLKKHGEVDPGKPILQEDSSVVCFIQDLRGTNIIAAKLEGKIEECEVLKEIAVLDSGIIEGKDSIIAQNSIILKKTKDGYEQELGTLKEQLKKETLKRKIITYSGGALLVGMLVLLIK